MSDNVWPPHVDIWSICEAKTRYESEEEASEYAWFIRIRHSNQKLGHYKCPHCEGWHIGTLWNQEEIDRIRESNQQMMKEERFIAEYKRQLEKRNKQHDH